jgi:O-antigen/teichoic acid export membrane protein
MDIKSPPIAVASAKSINHSTKKHLRGSTLLLAGRVISMGANFAVQVLTVRYLTKSDYGAFAYAMSLISLGSSIAVFGFGKTITRYAPIYQEKGEYNKLFGTIIMVFSTIVVLGLFLVSLVLGLRGWISETFIHDPLALNLLLLLIVLSPIEAVDSLLVDLLAVFASPRAIFFRRHILGPGLKLLVVLLLVLLGSDVYFLAIGYLIANAIGVIIYTGILFRSLRNQKLFEHFHIHRIKFPVKEIFSFSIPLFTTDLVFLIRHQFVVLMLGYFRNTVDVATFRAVLPVAGLNMVVIESFTFLFMPTLARMFANKDQEGVDDLYWQSAVWITVISFPVFLVTFSLAKPFTVLLFGERYAQSGTIMALLAFGYYFNAALGFNADTLRIYGKIRYVVAIDVLAMIISLGLSLILIPRYGALGAAIGTCGTLVVHNILNHTGLKFSTQIDLFQWQYVKVYGSILLGTVSLYLFQTFVSPPIYVGLVIAGIISLVILFLNRRVLNVEQTFPELMRYKLVQVLLKNDHVEYETTK